MREIRPSGSEGGARFNPLLLPYPRQLPPFSFALGVPEITRSSSPQNIFTSLKVLDLKRRTE